MPFRFAERSLASQIAWVFGTLIIVVAMVLSVVFGDLLRARIRSDAGTALHVIANSVSRQLEAQLRARAEQVEVLARSTSLWERGLDSAAARQLFARVQTLTPENLWIGVADVQGTVRAATGDLLVHASVAERPWFRNGLGGTYVGDVHAAALLASLMPAPASGEPLRFMDFAAPIEVDGQLRGVLGIHANWEWVNEVIRLAVPAEAATGSLSVFVFDSTGKLVYAPFGGAPVARAGRLPFVAPVAPAIQGATPGTATGVVRWDDGRDYLTSVTPVRTVASLNDLGWRIVVREPVDVAYRSARDVTWLTFGIGAVAAALASLLAYRAAQRLSRNLHRIALAAHTVETGRPGATMPLFGGSQEVTALSTALRRMTVQLLSANNRMEQEVRDRTRELVAANAELDRQARSDALTGLLNRRGFDERMRQTLAMAHRSGRPLAAVMVDADHFKRVNDRFGHEVGDTVLRFLSATLQSRLRASDVAGRMGGEEFVVLLPDTDAQGGAAMAEALRAAIAAHTDPTFGRITVSAGVAALRSDDLDGSTLLRHADNALYQAKHQGRDRVCIWIENAPQL